MSLEQKPNDQSGTKENPNDSYFFTESVAAAELLTVITGIRDTYQSISSLLLSLDSTDSLLGTKLVEHCKETMQMMIEDLYRILLSVSFVDAFAIAREILHLLKKMEDDLSNPDFKQTIAVVDQLMTQLRKQIQEK